MKTIYALTVLALPAIAACTSDIPTVNLGIDDSYRIERMRKLVLSPALTGDAYRWSVDGVTVSTDREYIFLRAEEGTYDLDTELYCLPYIVVDGTYYYPANATCWNLLGEMTEYSQDTDLTAEELFWMLTPATLPFKLFMKLASLATVSSELLTVCTL